MGRLLDSSPDKETGWWLFGSGAGGGAGGARLSLTID